MANQDSRRIEILLNEYQAAENHVTRLLATSWQATQVIFVIVVAISGFVLQPIIAGESTIQRGLAAVFICGSGILLGIWGLIIRRFTFLQQVAYWRMGQIETELGMRRLVLTAIIDAWDKRILSPSWWLLSESEREELSNFVETSRLRRLVFSSTKLTMIIFFGLAIALFVLGSLIAIGVFGNGSPESGASTP
ncbi:MAG: hypothetical protein HW388_1613 [Dehalococcoidia bacterium]|nr:hypothetical protein [Dehalococcoidia bacterium]